MESPEYVEEDDYEGYEALDSVQFEYDDSQFAYNLEVDCVVNSFVSKRFIFGNTIDELKKKYLERR